MKKIIFSIPNLTIGAGGVETSLCELVLALKKHYSYEISIITYKSFSNKNDIIFLHNMGINVFEIKNSKLLPGFINKLYRKVKAKKIISQHDIIIDYKYYYTQSYYKRIPKPKIVWLHCSINYLMHNLDHSILKNYKKIVCVSNNLACQINNIFPDLSKKVYQIYNIVDYSRITSHSLHPFYKTENKYFVAVQRLDPLEKDVETVINAFNLIENKYPNIRLYIVGDGDQVYKTRLFNLSNNNSKIIFTGAINNAAAIIKNAEAVILSSIPQIGEGLPMVLLEAHALGTVCISSNVQSGPAEVLMNGAAGFLFEPGNADNLARVMEVVLKDKQLCQEKIDCATKHLNRFSPEAVVENFVEMIESIES